MKLCHWLRYNRYALIVFTMASVFPASVYSDALPRLDRLLDMPLDQLMTVEVTTGTRKNGTTLANAASAIDIITREELASVASADLQDALQSLLPAFNVSRSVISDGGTFVRVPSFRNLPGSKLLVLINGKRAHRSALISLSGANSFKTSAHAADLSQYPIGAIERIDILRDGAAAQYGSDAIAGVINVILRKDIEGQLTVQRGQYYQGDGREIQLQGRTGTNWGEKASVNVHIDLNLRL